jgi:hypothetical protein
VYAEEQQDARLAGQANVSGELGRHVGSVFFTWSRRTQQQCPASSIACVVAGLVMFMGFCHQQAIPDRLFMCNAWIVRCRTKRGSQCRQICYMVLMAAGQPSRLMD